MKAVTAYNPACSSTANIVACELDDTFGGYSFRRFRKLAGSLNQKMNVRIIPRLDIKNSNLVKGVHLEGLRVLGKPERFARRYYEQGADELVFMDVVASLYGRNSLLDIVERTAREVFVPLTVGGGIRTTDDIKRILRAGADKVSLNTAAIKQPQFVRDAARKFGSSTIVVSIEAIQKRGGGYEAYVDNGREKTGVDAFEWAARAVELGAGELLVTSIDREGTGRGYDTTLVRQIADSVPVPVIACGGAGSVNHVLEVFSEGHADAAAIASVLHYHLVKQGPDPGEEFDPAINTAHIAEGRGFAKIVDASLVEIKETLGRRGYRSRQVPEVVANA